MINDFEHQNIDVFFEMCAKQRKLKIREIDKRLICYGTINKWF